MKKYLFALLLLSPLRALPQDTNIVFRGIPDSLRQQTHADIGAFSSQVNFPPFVGWNKGGEMLFNGGKALYAMAAPDGEIEVYRSFERPLSGHLSPDNKGFFYLEDEEGDENYRLYYYGIRKNNRVALSAEGDKSYDPFWCPDGKRFAFKSNRRNPAEVDLYLSRIGATSPQLLFERFSDDGQVYDWSAERGELLAVKVVSENDKLLYLLDDQTGAATQINAGRRGIAYAAAKFIPHQNACLVVSDEFSERLQLHRYDLDARTFTPVTADISWDVEALAIDEEGRRATFSVNENGISKLYLLDVPTLTYTVVDGLPEGVVRGLRINPQGTEVGFNCYGNTFYRKVFGYDVATGTLRQYAQEGKLPRDTVDFVRAEPFTYPSVDPQTGVAYQVPAFVYRPPGGDRLAPVLVDIHGGPEYQARPTFNSFHQYLVGELGVAVVVPNVRGSNGYGKSYMKLDDGHNRENAVEDVGALLDWVARQAGLDAERVALYGESYGGYVVLASLARYPQLRGGIDVVGISNWLSYLANTSDYRRDLRRVEFGDERDSTTREYLARISPVRNVDQIAAPLLIFQGRNDPRVDYQESEQMYEALRAADKKVWYVLANNEGHGFHRYRNYLMQRHLTVSFLKKYLLPTELPR